MIQSGGWSRMRTCDEHTKLARVSLDFMPDLDSAFQLDVTKGKSTLPTMLRNQLAEHIEKLCSYARGKYGAAGGGGASVGKKGGKRGLREHRPKGDSVSARRIGTALHSAAIKTGELLVFGKIQEQVRKDDPEVAGELGW
jgi:hypothetical protein